MKKRLQVRLEESQLERVRRLARESDRSIASQLRRIVREWFQGCEAAHVKRTELESEKE